MATMASLTQPQRDALERLTHSGEVYYNTQHKSIVVVMFDLALTKIKPDGRGASTGGSLEDFRGGRGRWEEIVDLPGANYPSAPTGASVDDTLAWLDGKANRPAPTKAVSEDPLDSFLRNAAN